MTSGKSQKEPFRALPWWRRKRKKRQNLNAKGHEVNDPTVIEPPIGFVAHEPLSAQIARMVRSETLKQELENSGHETFEEADDFDIEEDDFYDPQSPYENDFDHTPLEELRRRKDEAERLLSEAEERENGKEEDTTSPDIEE